MKAIIVGPQNEILLMKRLFIIGGMRCGTSSLAYYLKQHPQIFNSKVKEPNYMVFADSNQRYLRSNHIPMKLMDYAYKESEYNRLYENALPGQILVDASTSYMSYEHAAVSIKKRYPDAYVIVSLRDPVDRAISAYKFNRARGTESRESLFGIVKDELNGGSKDLFSPWRYIHCSDYSRHLQIYYDLFDKNQILFIDFEDIQKNISGVLMSITTFLGINYCQFDTTTRVNQSSAPNRLSRTINSHLVSGGGIVAGIKTVAKRILPSISTAAVIRVLENSPLPKTQIDLEDLDNSRSIIQCHFSESRDYKKLINA